ncbi:TPA: hypothetical protein DCG86_06045 [Candidatus Marinimicrobia bacterium]|nr:hypothetical protein [Candidatus Neomarinimicrobiota bacterium]
MIDLIDLVETPGAKRRQFQTGRGLSLLLPTSRAKRGYILVLMEWGLYLVDSRQSTVGEGIGEIGGLFD